MKRLIYMPFVLLILVIFALYPFLNGHVPWQGDGLLHIYRLGALERATAAGDWFPRWVSDLGLGYGFPLFNYYAPLSYYILLPFRWAGLSVPTAATAGYALATFTLAAGGYLWGDSLWGRWGGTATAVSLVYAPYWLYNLHHRAALAELWGLVWLVLTLAALHRAAQTRPAAHRTTYLPRWLPPAVTYTALILTHNITALLATPFLLAYTAYLLFRYGRTALHTTAYLLLGLGLSAFFWLPALGEQAYVQIENLYKSTNFAYQTHFLGWEMIWPLPPLTNPAWLNPPLQPQLSLWLVALLPAVVYAAVRTTADRRRPLLLLTVGTGTAVFLATPLSAAVWDALPLLHFAQFPWRFVGPASIGLAGMMGFLAAHLRERPYGLLGTTAATAVLLLCAWPYLQPAPPPDLPTTITAADSIAFETRTGWLGTTAAADYLPRTAAQIPTRPADPAQSLGQHPFTLSLNQPTRLRVSQFYFPGWQATLNGRPLPLTHTDPHGLILTDRIPAGTHRLQFTFENTPLRRLANGLTVLTLVLILPAVVAHLRRAYRPRLTPPQPVGLPLWPAAGLVAGLLAVAAPGLLAPLSGWWDGSAPPAPDTMTALNFENQLQLVGYDLSSAHHPADRPLTVRLYWRSPGTMQEYSVGVFLVDDAGHRFAQADHMHPGHIPVPRWPDHTYTTDTYTLSPAVATPPGDYRLQVVVYETDTGRRLAYLNPNGRAVQPTYDLTAVALAPPQTPPDPDQLTAAITTRLDPPAVFNQTVSLLGYNLPQTRAAVGQALPLTTFWHTPPPNHTLSTTVSFSHGSYTATHSLTAAVPDGITVMRHEATLTAPVMDDRQRPLPGGTYTVKLGDHALTEIDLEVPARRFEPLTGPTINQTVGDFAVLHTAVPMPSTDGRTLTVELTWQASALVPRPYVTFVQLLAPDNTLIAQSDHPPGTADLPRPTTGWVPGEYVTDRHTLSLPTDFGRPARLIVGLYDPATGQRLPTAEGDYLLIHTLN